MARTLIHFGSFDGRFCGSQEPFRRFTTDENEVTCPKCKDRDRLYITEQGLAALIEMQRAGKATDER